MKAEIYTEKIICPQCGKVCTAEVERSFPWDLLAHECEHCGYMILESEWEKIK